MQHSPSYYFYLIVTSALLLIMWLGFRLLSKWHPFYSRKSFTYMYWLLSLGSLAYLPLSRYFRLMDGSAGSLFQSITYGVYAWLVGLVALILIMAVLYLLRLVANMLGRHNCHQAQEKSAPGAELPAANGGAISRRNFLQGLAVAAPATSWAVSGGGILVGDHYIAAQHHNLPFANLPSQLSGFKVAQLSDTHVGTFFDMTKLDRVLSMIENERPDLLVITGDMIDDLNLLTPAMERINRFAATMKHGIYYCWGNHEYFRDISLIRAAWKVSPVKVLENSNVKILDGERPFYLVGVDYPWATKKDDQQAVRRSFLSRALAGVPDNAFRLLIAHHPDFFDNSFDNNIELALAGHTHGGQVALFGKSLLPIQYKYMRGLYEQQGNYGYVNVGAGHWLPFRLGCSAEVSFFTFRPASPPLSAKTSPGQ